MKITLEPISDKSFEQKEKEQTLEKPRTFTASTGVLTQEAWNSYYNSIMSNEVEIPRDHYSRTRPLRRSAMVDHSAPNIYYQNILIAPMCFLN